MKILIVGAGGFIGGHLFNHFEKLKFDVVGCDHVFPNQIHISNLRVISVISSEFTELVEQFTPDYCINAAGSGNVGLSIKEPQIDFELNVNLLSELLNVLRQKSPMCKVLHISSAAVYGNPNYLPIDENLSCLPISPYGFHKWMSELLCKEYNMIYGMKMAIVRPFSVYGEGLQKQILWELCWKCNEQKEVELFGRGIETRDFIHISDLCNSIELIVNKSNFNCEIYNIANGKGIEIKEIANQISKIFSNCNIQFNQKIKEGDPLFWRADISKIKSLGYRQKITIDKGISDYVKWFLKKIND